MQWKTRKACLVDAEGDHTPALSLALWLSVAVGVEAAVDHHLLLLQMTKKIGTFLAALPGRVHVQDLAHPNIWIQLCNR
jgi:hypothetical protein